MVSWIERITGSQTRLSPKQEFEEKLKEIDKLIEEFEFDQNVSGIAHHNQGELDEEFCKLITLSNRLKSISLNPILRNWKNLSFIARDIISTLLILKKNNLNPEQIKEIRASIEEQIIGCEFRLYPPPLKFIAIKYHRAINSKYFITKMVYGLTVSSSISLFVFVTCFSARWVIQHSKYDSKNLIGQTKLPKSSTNSTEDSTNKPEIPTNIQIFQFKNYLSQLKEERKTLDEKIRIEKIQNGNNEEENKEVSDNLKDLEKKRQATQIKIEDIEKKKATLQKEKEKEKNLDLISLIIIAISVGALGSTISMIVRIQEFDSAEKNYNDPSIPILIGIYRPLIGASFSLFIFSLVSAEIISIQHLVQTPSKKMFFYISISFVAGFSERFARSLIQKTEETFIKQTEENLVEKDNEYKNELLEEIDKLKPAQEPLKNEVPLYTLAVENLTPAEKDELLSIIESTSLKIQSTEKGVLEADDLAKGIVLIGTIAKLAEQSIKLAKAIMKWRQERKTAEKTTSGKLQRQGLPPIDLNTATDQEITNKLILNLT